LHGCGGSTSWLVAQGEREQWFGYASPQ
jgi:hypothetical protein